MNGARGKRDADYRAGETALLLVDMQRVWLERGLSATGGHGPDEDFLRDAAERVIPNQRRLLEAARRARVEVLHTIIRSLTRDGRDRSLDHKLTPIHLAPDAPEALPIEPLVPIDDEIVIPKTSSGVFNSTNIDYLLRNLGIRYLVIAGIMTDQCVDMAVRDAADRGYLVTCVGDACAASTTAQHEAALRAFGGYCWIADTTLVVSRFNALVGRAP